MVDIKERPHRHYNPLTEEWVLVSPHRTQRPWQGQIEETAQEHQPEYDPTCYLCPGNGRAGGLQNPNYTSTFVFDNDFAALLHDTPDDKLNQDDLIVAEGESGICRVVCFSPRHDLTVARMNVPDIRKVVDTWVDQYVELVFSQGCDDGSEPPAPTGGLSAAKKKPARRLAGGLSAAKKKPARRRRWF